MSSVCIWISVDEQRSPRETKETKSPRENAMREVKVHSARKSGKSVDSRAIRARLGRKIEMLSPSRYLDAAFSRSGCAPDNYDARKNIARRLTRQRRPKGFARFSPRDTFAIIRRINRIDVEDGAAR